MHGSSSMAKLMYRFDITFTQIISFGECIFFLEFRHSLKTYFWKCITHTFEFFLKIICQFHKTQSATRRGQNMTWNKSKWTFFFWKNKEPLCSLLSNARRCGTFCDFIDCFQDYFFYFIGPRFQFWMFVENFYKAVLLNVKKKSNGKKKNHSKTIPLMGN